MPSTSELKKGVRFEHEDEPYTTVDVFSQSPSARGGSTLVKVKARNMISGAFRSFSFKSGERLDEPDIELMKCQFLYADGDDYNFMNQENYEQYLMRKDTMGGTHLYLKEEMEIRLLFYEGQAVSLELPNVVELAIAETEPGMKGDTVTNVTKTAVMETGLEVQVPLFINQEDKIRVDTRDNRYIERVKR
jgi:elongation factor P